MTHEPDSEPTARLVELLNTDPPPDVEARMRERLTALRTRMESPTVTLAERRQKRSWWLAAAAMAAAAALLVALVLVPIGSSSALAQIVEAVAAKPWLHARGTGPDGEPAEMWFSAQKGVVGFRTGKVFVFVDQVQGTIDVYGGPGAADSVQRAALEYAPAQGIEAARHSFLALLSGDLKGAMQSDGNQVLEHATKTVREKEREWIEHRFVVGHAGRDDMRSENVLRVDPKTNLPDSWQMAINGQVMFDFQVGYPDRGPLTIAAMGVPEGAPIVDSAPQGEFKRVLLATTAARRRFDDYHAVVVESASVDRATAWGDMYRVWRKGNLWRVDQCQPNFDVREEPPGGAESKAWWLKQVQSMRSFPREIWDGKQLWQFEPQYFQPSEQDPANPRFRRIESLHLATRPVADRNDPQSYGFVLQMPEFYGYEHLDRGASIGFKADTRPVELNLQPMTLVEIFNISSKSPSTISPHRYWLDPQRGHLMVRKEQFQVSKPGVAVGASEVVSAARTPQGLWYPTVVRLIGNTVSLEDGSRSDSFVRYYVEFDREIPDSLFDAGSVDERDFWTVSQ